MSAMEDTFKLRVNKIFGSLSSSPSSNSSSGFNSSWSLTDDEVEKIEWGRDRGSPEPEESAPYPSNLDGFFSKQREDAKSRRSAVEESKMIEFSSEIEDDLEELDDEVDELCSPERIDKPEDHDDEEWEIRSSVGLDCTLDYEEEEDEFDKVAVGREKAGDRVFMSELIDHGTCSSSFSKLPISSKEVVRDTRVNHDAAKLRLKEDAETAGSFDSLTVSDKTQGPGIGVQSTGNLNLKSILKRKQTDPDLKSQKRVRFDPECEYNTFEKEFEKENDFSTETCSVEEAQITNEVSLLPQNQRAVPDYVQNPTKYTCYTLDSSSEVDEEANKRAYMDFLSLVRKSNTIEAQTEDVFVGLPKSVTFTPRKKSDDPAVARNSTDVIKDAENGGQELTQHKGVTIAIAAGYDEETDVSAMEEDETQKVVEISNSLQKSNRRYRAKVREEMDDIP